MKILMVSSKVRTYALGFQNCLEPLMSLGHDVLWAADFSSFVGNTEKIPCETAQIDIRRNPLDTNNLRAYKELLRLIRDKHIEAIYCSTPIGGLLGRIAGWRTGVRPVIYAAHGFLFFEGAPLINRTIYKWEEVILAHWTDALITINDEDFRAAQKLKTRSNRKPYLIHGAGVKVGAQVNIDRACKRQELGVPEDAFLIMSAGYLETGKDNDVIIRAVALLDDRQVHYVLCGEGKKGEKWKELSSRLGVSEQIHFLGYRTDVAEIIACSDVFAMPSLMEGIPRALLEAMDLGLACVGTATRGIMDLLGDNEGGLLCPWGDEKRFADALKMLKADEQLRADMGKRNRNSVQAYSSECVRGELYQICKEILGDQNDHREERGQGKER